jgi:hypothetical protein
MNAHFSSGLLRFEMVGVEANINRIKAVMY